MKKQRKRAYPNAGGGAPSWAGLKSRALDGSGIEMGGTMNLSTPIVSVQDGPRMSTKNFGGRKAAPFRKGKKRRAKVLAAKASLKKKGADLSVLDAADRKALPASAFVFPKTREFPIPDVLHAKVALRLAGRVDPSKAAIVRATVFKRYPNLKPSKED